MKKLRSGNSYYLDRDEFSSVTSDVLWRKLTEYVKETAGGLTNISYDDKNYSVSVTSTNKDVVSGFVKPDDTSVQLDMNLNRTLFLNACFDKELKGTVLSNDNMESYPKGNTVEYVIQCSVDPASKNSLFFHESALQNYTKDFTPEAWIGCKDYLAVVSYNKIIEQNGVHMFDNGMMFLNYNEDEDKVSTNGTFGPLNDGVDANIIESFINHYNNTSIRSSELIVGSGNSEARNFKIAISMFKLPNKDAMHFIDFKSFVAAPIYNQFIENLLKRLA